MDTGTLEIIAERCDRQPLNFDWLQDKRLRLLAKALSTFLGSILLFAGLVNLFGYINTAVITIIGALVLWIAVNQAVEKASPQPTVSITPKISTPATPTSASPTLHPVCGVGPYKVEAGEIRSIELEVRQGQKVKGHLKEIDKQPFDWYIADEKNMILIENGQRDKFASIEGGYDEKAYRVNRKIPYPARWYLILDTYGKQYSRKVRVDFEPVGGV